MCGGGGGGPSQAEIDAQNAALRDQQNKQNYLMRKQMEQQQRQYNQSFAHSSSSESAAIERENARLAQIQAAQGGVNKAFGNRQGVYQNLEDQTFNMNRDKLMDNRSDASRNLKFALARAGTSGGAVDVDKNTDLLDRYNTGLVQARSHASDQAGALKARDEQLRASLLGAASSGTMTGGSAYNQAVQGLSNNAAAPAYMGNIGSIFAGLSDAIGQAAMIQGMGVNPYGSEDEFSSYNFSSPGDTYAGQVS